MPNDLTGDYDVVAQFSLDAVNRILAGMHRGKRLPHALSMAVDDYPDPRTGVGFVSIVDRLGNAVLDPAKVRKTAREGFSSAALTAEVIRNVDPVVNWRPDPPPPPAMQTMSGPSDLGIGALGIAGTQTSVIDGIGISEEYSHLSGVAQLQLGPPTMKLPGNRTDRGEVHTPVMLRYIAEPQTMPLAQFMRGNIVTTFGVKQVSSKAGSNVVVDTAGAAKFDVNWSSLTLDPKERTAIDKALTKSLKESFQPSTTPFPSNVKRMHFKGFPGQNAIAVMMNVQTNNNAGPGSVENVFLQPDDHFALAVNGEAITIPFAAAVNSAISPRTQKTDTKIEVDYLIGTKTFHIYTSIYVLDATVELVDLILASFVGAPTLQGTGAILLTIPVQVRFGWANKPDIVPDPVDFDFTITQLFTLTLNGRHVGIQRLGGVSVNIPPGVPGMQANEARNKATTLFDNAWNKQSASVQQQVDNALNADALQNLVKSLMNPTLTSASPANAPEQVDPELNYTSFTISPAGIALRGSVAVPPWSQVHVEFDKDPWSPASGPEYRALRSWIPGGTIKSYEWNFGKPGTLKDTRRFITVNAPALSVKSNKICLTFSGQRITASGPIFYENVSSPRSCKWTSPVVTKFPGIDWSVADRPQTVVPKPRPGPDPQLRFEAVAHVSPWAQEGVGGGTANLVVHFPDERSLRHLEIFPQALAHSGRTDTATAILCVLDSEQSQRVRDDDDLIFADDSEAWERLLGVRDRPATVILNPNGETVWRSEGAVEERALAAALRTHLAAGGQFYPQFVESALSIGQLSPNFIVEVAPGERLTLRKLSGRPLALLFWRSSSPPSITALRNLQKAYRQRGVEPPLILAIEDGSDEELARGIAGGDDDPVIVVSDPDRQIARAYGITMWPTIVFLDPDQIVRDIRLGLIDAEELEVPGRDRETPERDKEETGRDKEKPSGRAQSDSPRHTAKE
jgi:peroxiredoxin